MKLFVLTITFYFFNLIFIHLKKDAARELGDVKKGSGKKNYATSSTTFQRQREIFCAKMIQIVWRKHVENKKMERVEKAKEMSGSVVGSMCNAMRRCAVEISVEDGEGYGGSEDVDSDVFSEEKEYKKVKFDESQMDNVNTNLLNVKGSDNAKCLIGDQSKNTTDKAQKKSELLNVSPNTSAAPHEQPSISSQKDDAEPVKSASLLIINPGYLVPK